MGEAASIAYMLAVRGWLPEPPRKLELVFNNAVKKKLYRGGESDDIIVVDLSRVGHYVKSDNHLFIDLSRDRVYHKQGYVGLQTPNADGRIFPYIVTSRDVGSFYDNLDILCGTEDGWRKAQLEPKRHTAERWQKLIEMGL